MQSDVEGPSAEEILRPVKPHLGPGSSGSLVSAGADTSSPDPPQIVGISEGFARETCQG